MLYNHVMFTSSFMSIKLCLHNQIMCLFNQIMIKLWSCNLVVYVALGLCSSFLQT